MGSAIGYQRSTSESGLTWLSEGRRRTPLGWLAELPGDNRSAANNVLEPKFPRNEPRTCLHERPIQHRSASHYAARVGLGP